METFFYYHFRFCLMTVMPEHLTHSRLLYVTVQTLCAIIAIGIQTQAPKVLKEYQSTATTKGGNVKVNLATA